MAQHLSAAGPRRFKSGRGEPDRCNRLFLFIKYYPEWGRGFDEWTGGAFNMGIAQDKNCLGADLLILGLFLFWYFLRTWRTEKSRARRNELILIGGLLLGGWWLLSMAHSS